MEFDYAVEQKIPIIALMRDDLGSIPAEDTEATDAGKAALRKFRAKLKTGREAEDGTHCSNMEKPRRTRLRGGHRTSVGQDA
jgi:hypothetical protein